MIEVLQNKTTEILNRINEIEKIIVDYDITDNTLIISLKEEISEHHNTLKTILKELNLLRDEKIK